MSVGADAHRRPSRRRRRAVAVSGHDCDKCNDSCPCFACYRAGDRGIPVVTRVAGGDT